MNKNPNSDGVHNFLKVRHEAYWKSGKYILKKLPLNNKVLQKFSCIGPTIVTSPSTAILKTYLSYPALVHNVMSDEQNNDIKKKLECFLVIGNYLLICRPMETIFIVCSGGWRSINSILCYSKWLHQFFLTSLQK